MKKLIKSNIKLLIVIGVIILITVVGTTLALTLRFNSTNVDITTANIKVNIRYEKDEEGNDINKVSSIGSLIPIELDSSNIDNAINSNNVLKYKFWISGDLKNPSNTIYDLSLNNIIMDCELKSPYVKWILYKNNKLLYDGNFSPEFDSMPNNRMILTNTEEDLNTSEDEYLLVIYIEEACSNSKLNSCSAIEDQSSLLGRSFSAEIGIETSTNEKKENVRSTSEKVSCTEGNTSVNKPVCNDNLVYNGINQLLLKETVPTGVTVNQINGINAGEYTVTARLASGYKWSDNSVGDYTFTCKINRRSITINTQNQISGSFVSNPSKVDIINLVSNHILNSIHLNTITASNGDIIIAGNAIIYDENGNNVTNNYTINYQSTGTIINE